MPFEQKIKVVLQASCCNFCAPLQFAKMQARAFAYSLKILFLASSANAHPIARPACAAKTPVFLFFENSHEKAKQSNQFKEVCAPVENSPG